MALASGLLSGNALVYLFQVAIFDTVTLNGVLFRLLLTYLDHRTIWSAASSIHSNIVDTTELWIPARTRF